LVTEAALGEEVEVGVVDEGIEIILRTRMVMVLRAEAGNLLHLDLYRTT
jgi:hypothetical protein